MEQLDIKIGGVMSTMSAGIEDPVDPVNVSLPVDVIQEANAVRYTPQNLTDEQKTIARANIGAMAKESLEVEEWEFEMEDGSIVTKKIVLWKEG